ncbi:MAG: hypothetical protein M1819_006914 [Sarea resinae]|nr:MAG: hypothetical protein M1819_006914 [Sarea resinae]
MRNFRRDHPNVVPPTLMRREAPLGNVDSAFPSARDPLPEGLTDEQIIQSYPNHLRGEIASRIAAELFEDDWAAFAAAVTAATGNTMGEGTLRLRAQRYRESLPEPQPVLQGRPNNRAERRAQNEATGYHDENDQAMAEGPAYNTRAQQRMTQARTSTGPGSADLQIANFPGSDEVMPEGLDPREIVDRFPNHLHGLTLVRVLDEISVDEIAARVGHGLTPENLTDRRYAAGNWEELEESSEESTDSENQNGEEADADPVQPPQQQPVQPAPVQNDQLVGARPNENGQLFADDATEVERVLESGNVDPGLLDLTRSPQEAYMGRGSGLEDIEMEFGLNQLGAFGDLEGMNMEANHFEGGEPEGSVEQADGDEGLIQDAFDEFINPDMVEDDEDVDMEDSENDDEDVEMEG